LSRPIADCGLKDEDLLISAIRHLQSATRGIMANEHDKGDLQIRHPPSAIRIIDAHQHLWDLTLLSYMWCRDIPTLNRSFRMADYLEATSGLDVYKSVHVEADVDEPDMLQETRYVLALAEKEDNPLSGVVACGRPESPDFRSYLDQIAGHPKLKGLRRILHTQPDELGQSQRFIENVRVLEAYGLSFDICVRADQLPIAINLVWSAPRVSFILDHCGVPRVRERGLDPWRSYMREISHLPNVVCKVSGIVAYADPDHWTPEDLRPFVDHTIECFGWDRVMFGSDWPVCTLSASLKQWVEALLFLTQDAGKINRAKLFHENANRIYRL
jgi:predicted TIM-barrel fold metal-dependent hydrolase